MKMPTSVVWLSALALAGGGAKGQAAQVPAKGDPKAAKARGRGSRLRQGRAPGPHLAQHRPLSRRPVGGGGGRREPAHDLLLRGHGGRGLQDHERRGRLEARDGRPARHRIRGRHRGGGVGPERGVRRHGRGLPARQPLARRRGLQVGGRGQDLDEHRPQGHPPHRRRGRPSREPRPRLRGRPRPRLRAEPGARRLPEPGRRQDLGQGPLRGREHGRGGAGHGPLQPPRALRRHVPGAAQPLGLRQRRPGQRPLQVRGRRRHLEEGGGRGPAQGRLGQGRT